MAADEGAARHPAWYHNWLVQPEARVEVGAESWPIRALIVTGPERERLFDVRALLYLFTLEYQQRTTRQIPIVILVHQEGA